MTLTNEKKVYRPKIDREDSYGITGFVGPEGSGKTSLMTAFALRRHYKGIPIYTFPGYDLLNLQGEPISTRVETADWITLPSTGREIVICIDEIDVFFNSMKFMTTINQLWSNIMKQRRHRDIEVLYTLQDWGDVDFRVRKASHYLAVCTDAKFSAWGRENGIGRGERIDWVMYDIKGFKTGRPWTPSRPRFLKAKPIWPCFDSYADISIWEGMSKVEIKRPLHVIDLTKSPAAEGEEYKTGNPLGPHEDAARDRQAADTAFFKDLAGKLSPEDLWKVRRRVETSD